MKRCLLVCTCLAMCIAGCRKRVERPEFAFGSDDGEFVLTVVIDMSSSFQGMMARDGKAWDFMCQVVDKYFRDRIGSSDKLIIAQLSGSDKAVLWQGTPLQLRRDFASGAAFRNWLSSCADPRGSLVYDGIVQAVEYTLSDPIMESGKGKAAVFILSDMVDTSDSDQASERAVEALAAIGRDRGVVGLYFVDVKLCSKWRRMLTDAGIPASHMHVEAEVVGSPLLPTFN